MVKKTLIIGGTSGIGFAVASALAEQGESLILAGRDSEKLARARQLLSQKSASVDTVVLDISKEEEVIQLSQTLGEVDNVIVTAGSQAPGGALASLNLNEARLAFDTKFWGSIHVARHLSKNIKARGYPDADQRALFPAALSRALSSRPP
ncbi:Uncharacterized oxidoreductase SAV2478 [Raoultella planticola]|uniref:Uncharacterized oxidoreductase SAV2478 n=1 Tax=Raoultella planticola TaxID=575 RepID=A0A485D713_RAOPL|nr:Uncharacterized oxidoreductase SAV2478 [Raoultella planticola]